MAAIFGESKIFGKLPKVHSLHILWVENFDEIVLSLTVKEIEANLCFSIFGKNLKIQNGCHCWEEENFLKIANSRFLTYPVGRKLLSNTVMEIEANLCFFLFGKNSKWLPFLGRGEFFENCQDYIVHLPFGSEILTKSFYLARLMK